MHTYIFMCMHIYIYTCYTCRSMSCAFTFCFVSIYNCLYLYTCIPVRVYIVYMVAYTYIQKYIRHKYMFASGLSEEGFKSKSFRHEPLGIQTNRPKACLNPKSQPRLLQLPSSTWKGNQHHLGIRGRATQARELPTHSQRAAVNGGELGAEALRVSFSPFNTLKL